MLEEEGKIFLTDPVSKYIPAFKGQTSRQVKAVRSCRLAARSPFAI